MFKDKKILITILFVSLIFIVSAYLSQRYQGELALYLQSGNSFWTLMVYVLVVILATVIAPVTSLPLIAVMANIWGSFTAAVITIIGWVIGSFIAFFIARKYSQPLVDKMVPKGSLDRIRNMMPESGENQFWTIVLLRMIIPTDILSYALSLFTRVEFKIYALATLVGVIPGGFIFSYTGTLPVKYQTVVFLLGGAIIFTMYWLRHKKTKKQW